jgi:hypothetical protein
MATARKDADSARTSAEPWEIEFVHQQFPTYPEEEITRALAECKKELLGAKDRNKISKCVRRKLV